MKKGVLVLMLLMVACLLFGCCSHKWEAATCKTPKTCSECGKTEGDVAEHIAGDWEQEPDYVTGLVWERQYCEICSAQLDVEIAGGLNSMHQNGRFLFSPSEFCERAEWFINHVNEEAGEPDYDYTVELTDISGYISYIIYRDNEEIVQGLFHGTDPLIETSKTDTRNEITKIFASFKTEDTYEVVKVIAGLILVSDVTLEDVEEAVDILDVIIDKSLVGKAYIDGDLYYTYVDEGDSTSLMIGVL